MTVPELLQLYAPLAGMLALAFWVGVLSERVSGLQRAVKKLEEDAAESDADSKDITRLQVQMEAFEKSMEKLSRGMEGVQRQLGNLMQGNRVQPFHVDPSVTG